MEMEKMRNNKVSKIEVEKELKRMLRNKEVKKIGDKYIYIGDQKDL